MKYYLIYLAALALLSVIAFCLYGADKRKAKQGAWRIKEATLLGFGFCGGAIGALAAMEVFRHKTKHWYFWAVNLLGLAWQVVVFVLLLKL